MSAVLKFTQKSISIFILLMLVTSSIRPYSASAQVAAKGNIVTSPIQTMVTNAVPLGANVIQDSGLEESYGTGYPGYPWGSQPETLCIYWDQYCNIPGVGYHSGGAWALFGRGTNEFIYQYVTFPRCGATLKFYLYIGEYAPGAEWGMDNYIIGYIDSSVIFTADGYDINSYQPYQLVGIDASEFADGATHLVEFYGVTPDYGTFFNIDDIALYATNTKNCAEVAVKMGGSPQGTYGIPQNGGDRQSFLVNNGPAFVNSTNNVPFVASERVAYVSGGIATSFSELMGLPTNLVSNKYSFPAYDNLNFNSQLRFGNVSNAPITVRVYIGGHEMTSGCLADGQPSNSPYTLGLGASLRVSCPGVNGGPAVVQSTGGNIVAALRVIPNVYNGSFSEIMGLPQSQVGTTYLFPWYNNASLNTQLRIGNVSGSTASVRLYIGVNEMTSGCTTIPSKLYPYTLAAGTAVRVSCPGVNRGPVRVVGTGNIVASERVAYLDWQHWDLLLRVDGVARRSINQDLPPPLVQQYGTRYAIADRECERLARYRACLHCWTGDDQWLSGGWTAFEQSLCAWGRSEQASKLSGGEQRTSQDRERQWEHYRGGARGDQQWRCRDQFLRVDGAPSKSVNDGLRLPLVQQYEPQYPVEVWRSLAVYQSLW